MSIWQVRSPKRLCSRPRNGRWSRAIESCGCGQAGTLSAVSGVVLAPPTAAEDDGRGSPTRSSTVGALVTASQTGTHKGGAFSFQPLWDMIVAAEPDLLD